MSRIKHTFNKLRKKNETALIPYLMAGDPDLATTRTLIVEMEKGGADIIELGAPFSDPLADGPTIQKAAIRSLRHHTSIADVLGLVADVRKASSIPLIIMTSYNLVFHYGEERFVYDVSLTGVTGARAGVQSSVEESLRKIKAHTDKPVAVGFGISTPDQAA